MPPTMRTPNPSARLCGWCRAPVTGRRLYCDKTCRGRALTQRDSAAADVSPRRTEWARSVVVSMARSKAYR